MKEETKIYAVTGIDHGSIIYANSEEEAKNIFHNFYNGESIIAIKQKDQLINL